MNGDIFPRLVQFTLHHVDTPDLVVRGLNGNQIGANIRRISPVGFEASVRTEETMRVPSRLEQVAERIEEIILGCLDERTTSLLRELVGEIATHVESEEIFRRFTTGHAERNRAYRERSENT